MLLNIQELLLQVQRFLLQVYDRKFLAKMHDNDQSENASKRRLLPKYQKLLAIIIFDLFRWNKSAMNKI